MPRNARANAATMDAPKKARRSSCVRAEKICRALENKGEKGDGREETRKDDGGAEDHPLQAAPCLVERAFGGEERDAGRPFLEQNKHNKRERHPDLKKGEKRGEERGVHGSGAEQNFGRNIDDEVNGAYKKRCVQEGVKSSYGNLFRKEVKEPQHSGVHDQNSEAEREDDERREDELEEGPDENVDGGEYQRHAYEAGQSSRDRKAGDVFRGKEQRQKVREKIKNDTREKTQGYSDFTTLKAAGCQSRSFRSVPLLQDRALAHTPWQ